MYKKRGNIMYDLVARNNVLTQIGNKRHTFVISTQRKTQKVYTYIS